MVGCPSATRKGRPLHIPFRRTGGKRQTVPAPLERAVPDADEAATNIMTISDTDKQLDRLTTVTADVCAALEAVQFAVDEMSVDNLQRAIVQGRHREFREAVGGDASGAQPMTPIIANMVFFWLQFLVVARRTSSWASASAEGPSHTRPTAP